MINPVVTVLEANDQKISRDQNFVIFRFQWDRTGFVGKRHLLHDSRDLLSGGDGMCRPREIPVGVKVQAENHHAVIKGKVAGINSLMNPRANLAELIVGHCYSSLSLLHRSIQVCFALMHQNQDQAHLALLRSSAADL